MAWDINQINQQFMANLPNMGEAFRAGEMQSQQRRAGEAKMLQDAQATQAAQLRAAQKQADVQAFIRNPTAQAASALQATYPEDREAFKASWETRDTATRQNDLREMSSIHGYLQSGRPQDAAAMIRRRIDADKAAGQPTADDEQFLAVIEEDPDAAKGQMALMLSAIVGPDKFDAVFKNVGEGLRSDAKLPGEVALTEAQAEEARVKATMAPDVIAAGITDTLSQVERRRQQTAIETVANSIARDRLDLDRETLITNTQLKLDEMAQTGTEVKGSSLEEMTKAVTSAQANEALAERTASLASRFAASDASGRGWTSVASESLAGAFGNQDPVSALRGEYQQLINSQAIKNLPPGAASDNDIKIAMRGFPPATADKDYVVSFLRGLEKLQRKAAAGDQRRADWISSNGNIGTAKRQIVVDGYTVMPGTTFAQFNKAMVAATAEPDTSSIDNLEQRYGR